MDEVNTAAKYIASVVGYTGLVVGVLALPWEAATRLLTIALLVLIVLLAFAIARAQSLRRQGREFESEIIQLRDQLREAKSTLEFADGMVALACSSSELPTQDRDHHYYEVVNAFHIDGDDATYFYRLHGVVVSDCGSMGLTLKVTGDAPVDAASLLLEAFDTPSRRSLPARLQRDDPYIKVVEIPFASPLARGEVFDVSMSLRWSGTFPRARRSDYVFLSWGGYASMGIDRYRLDMSCDISLNNVIMEVATKQGRERATVQPKMTSNQGRCMLTWAMSRPAELYLLRFEKVLAE